MLKIWLFFVVVIFVFFFGRKINCTVDVTLMNHILIWIRFMIASSKHFRCDVMRCDAIWYDTVMFALSPLDLFCFLSSRVFCSVDKSISIDFDLSRNTKELLWLLYKYSPIIRLTMMTERVSISLELYCYYNDYDHHTNIVLFEFICLLLVFHFDFLVRCHSVSHWLEVMPCVICSSIYSYFHQKMTTHSSKLKINLHILYVDLNINILSWMNVNKDDEEKNGNINN